LSAPASPEIVSARPPGLDPRTKIVLIAVAGLVLMSPGGLRFVPPALLLGAGLAAWEGAWRRLIGVIAATAVAGALGWLLPLWWANGLTLTVSAASAYLIRFVAIAGIGMHLLATTSPTQLSAALRASRAPRPIAVTMAVMLRFFPVVATEAVAVLDAMRLRGLAGVGGFVRHPILSLERFTVPMIASSLRASEDLSASAILRGLGSRRPPTTMIPPRFGLADLALVVIVAALTAAAVVLPAPLT